MDCKFMSRFSSAMKGSRIRVSQVRRSSEWGVEWSEWGVERSFASVWRVEWYSFRPFSHIRYKPSRVGPSGFAHFIWIVCSKCLLSSSRFSSMGISELAVPNLYRYQWRLLLFRRQWRCMKRVTVVSRMVFSSIPNCPSFSLCYGVCRLDRLMLQIPSPP